MAENMMSAAHKATTKKFRKRFDAIKWNSSVDKTLNKNRLRVLTDVTGVNCLGETR